MFKLVFQLKREYFLFFLISIFIYAFYSNEIISQYLTAFLWVSYYVYIYTLLIGLNKISKIYKRFQILFLMSIDIIFFITLIYASIFLAPLEPELIEFIIPIMFLYFMKNGIINPYILSKIINLAEIYPKNERVKIMEEFFLFLLFPILGFWILMPRLNEIYEKNEEIINE